MREIAEKDLLQYLSGREESRNLEFKEGFAWNVVSNRNIKERVIRAAIAMSNTPSGGDIVVGIRHDQRHKKYYYDGLTPAQLDSFRRNYEAIEREVHSYCYPPLNFEMLWGKATFPEASDQRAFVLARVQEFEVFPTLCVKNGKERGESRDFILKEDTIYARSKKAPWSSIRASTRELEEIIRNAADKYRHELKVRGYVKLSSLRVRLKEERENYE